MFLRGAEAGQKRRALGFGALLNGRFAACIDDILKTRIRGKKVQVRSFKRGPEWPKRRFAHTQESKRDQPNNVERDRSEVRHLRLGPKCFPQVAHSIQTCADCLDLPRASAPETVSQADWGPMLRVPDPVAPVVESEGEGSMVIPSLAAKSASACSVSA